MKRFSLCVIVLLTLTALSLFAGKPEKPGKPGGGGTDPEEPPVIDYSQGFVFSDVNLIIGEAERVTILSGTVDEPLALNWSQDTQDNASTRSVITANLDGAGSPEIVVSRYCGAGKVKGQAYYKLFINVFHEEDPSYTRSVDPDNTYGLFATTYTSNPIIDVMSYPAKVAAGDLDGDGDDELVVAGRTQVAAFDFDPTPDSGDFLNEGLKLLWIKELSINPGDPDMDMWTRDVLVADIDAVYDESGILTSGDAGAEVIIGSNATNDQRHYTVQPYLHVVWDPQLTDPSVTPIRVGEAWVHNPSLDRLALARIEGNVSVVGMFQLNYNGCFHLDFPIPETSVAVLDVTSAAAQIDLVPYGLGSDDYLWRVLEIIGDLNGDGQDEFVTTRHIETIDPQQSYFNDILEIWEFGGDGPVFSYGYGPQGTLPQGTLNQSASFEAMLRPVRVSDMNKDGHPELIVGGDLRSATSEPWTPYLEVFAVGRDDSGSITGLTPLNGNLGLSLTASPREIAIYVK